jgi:hypothetical protein
VARGWTTREGRFVRVRVKRLRDVNSDAVASLDAGVERMLQRLGAQEQTRLRLERVKIEYFLCQDLADVRALCGSSAPGYRLAGERVVTRSNCDLNALARVVVHVVAKELPHRAVPVLEEGTAAALGGWRDWSGVITAQRGAALTSKRDPALEAVLDPAGFARLPGATAVPAAAAWSEALLRGLGPERFRALYTELSTAAAPERAFDAAAVRTRMEDAVSKRGPALVDWLRTEAARVDLPLQAGCRAIPEETRTKMPVLRWRDGSEKWSMEAYETGEEYTFVIRPYAGPTPKWAQKLADSLAAIHGETPPPRKELQRPPGDPPQLALTVRRRVYNEPEAYESRLYVEHFQRKRYAGELWGMFIAPDAVRVWDYRRDVLVAAVAPDLAVAGAPALYDEPAGVMCFRIRRDVFAEPLVQYIATCAEYTGE